LCFDFQHGTTDGQSSGTIPLTVRPKFQKLDSSCAFATPRHCVSSDAGKINAKTPGHKDAKKVGNP
jgi:hypothetical protein